MTKNYTAFYKSPIGIIEIVGSEEGISFLRFVDEQPVNISEPRSCLDECIGQIAEYFRGTRKEFSITLQIDGTDFQKKVWNRLLQIPFGKTASYKDIATLIGCEKAVRAVGNANGSNKISLIIPCHRVIGTDGKLVGYGGGLWRKEWLLRHEKNLSLEK